MCYVQPTEEHWGFAFVDDTDLCVSGSGTTTQMAEQMQKSVTKWEGLLHATGDALVWKNVFGT